MTTRELDQWLDRLICPSCRGGFTASWVATPEGGRGRWGTLECGCTVYPVIDDVPVLLEGEVPVRADTVDDRLLSGPRRTDLVAQVIGPDPLAALVSLVTFPAGLWPLTRVAALRRLLGEGALAEATLAARARITRRMLHQRERTTTREWLARLYLRSTVAGDAFNHLHHRYGQPRHLALLGLVESLPEGPVIDVGCGFGHMSHGISLAGPGHDVLGIDHTFFGVWLARWWIAPQARFLCADGAAPLPLAAESGRAAVCSDALHYFRDPGALVEELRRVVGEGPIVLPRFANADHEPHEGFEHSAAEWADLLRRAGQVRMVGEPGALEAYRAGRTPVLPIGDAAARSAKWIYALVESPGTPWPDPVELPDWPPPHARGRLGINPMYVPSPTDRRHLRWRFPSGWFGFENADMADYLLKEVHLTDAQVRAIGANDVHDPVLRPLIEGFVVLGFPPRFSDTLDPPPRVRIRHALASVRDR